MPVLSQAITGALSSNFCFYKHNNSLFCNTWQCICFHFSIIFFFNYFFFIAPLHPIPVYWNLFWEGWNGLHLQAVTPRSFTAFITTSLFKSYAIFYCLPESLWLRKSHSCKPPWSCSKPQKLHVNSLTGNFCNNSSFYQLFWILLGIYFFTRQMNSNKPETWAYCNIPFCTRTLMELH